MNAGRILFALARHFDWWQNRMISEYEIDGSRADLAVVSKAGYLTEVEIKVSRADWLRDGKKPKWVIGSRGHISRFFYAIPSTLLTRGIPLELDIPSFIPEHVGILVVYDDRLGYDYVREVRAATRFKARKLSEEQLRAIDKTFYYRFWRMQMGVLRRRFERHEECAA